MAIKSSTSKNYAFNPEIIIEALRNPKFSELIESAFLEEAKTNEGIEFRYVRKTSVTRYGRNFFINIFQNEDNTTKVTVTTQSRKVTVLFDTQHNAEATKALNALDVIVELIMAQQK